MTGSLLSLLHPRQKRLRFRHYMGTLRLTTCVVVTSVVFAMIGCSSSSNLRKFDEGDIAKEFATEEVKKFEVKDVSALGKATPAPSPTATKKAPVKKKAAKATAPEAFEYPNRRPEKVPFAVGERLEYGIRYIGVTAATLKLELAPNKVVNGRQVHHIKAHAETVAFFELVYRVDDKIESFFDYDGMFSHRFTMELDETKQSRKTIELYDYEKKKSFYWNRVDHAEKGLSEQKETHDIVRWSQDPISSLYYLRVANLPTTPGAEFRYPVIIDGKQWESVLKYVKQEKIYAGKDYQAHLYSLANYHNGELKNGENKVWISADENRYILRVEAKVKIGSFAIALDRVY